MSERIKKAEYLLDEIGGIDDGLLHEAMSTRRKRRTYIPVIVAAAVAMLVIMSLGVSVVLQAVDNLLPTDKNESQGPINGDAAEKYDSLDSLMTSYKDKGFATLDADELPYHEGGAYLIWQYEGEDFYHISDPLTETQTEGLMSDLGYGAQVSGEVSLDCKVWLLLSDGSVKSPYLKNTDGNTGAAVFDYNPEINPTQSFVDNVLAIID